MLSVQFHEQQIGSIYSTWYGYLFSNSVASYEWKWNETSCCFYIRVPKFIINSRIFLNWHRLWVINCYLWDSKWLKIHERSWSKYFSIQGTGTPVTIPNKKPHDPATVFDLERPRVTFTVNHCRMTNQPGKSAKVYKIPSIQRVFYAFLYLCFKSGVILMNTSS